MAITTRMLQTGYAFNNFFPATDMTNDNEVIFQLDPGCKTMVEAVMTAPGQAMIRSSLREETPADFSGFTPDMGMVSQTTTWNLPSGLRWVGLDVVSGSWTMYVRQVRVAV